MSSYDDQLARYALGPGFTAGSYAALTVFFGIHFLHVPHTHPLADVLLFLGVWIGLAMGVILWRVVRRSYDQALYRAQGQAWTITEDWRDGVRLLLTGLAVGGLTLLVLWLNA